MKRLMDISGAALGLMAVFPIFVWVALAILLTSPGPALFRQRRVGRDGRDFILFKFRTMTERKEAEAGEFESGSSARVTPFGRFLRRTKLDEWPQLWNVVRGDMSLVGPRPEVRIWTEAYPDRWAGILRVRPGITDPASIVFRNEEELLAAAADPDREYRLRILPRKLDLYENYLRCRSLAGDVNILIRTLAVLLTGRPGHSARRPK